MLTITQTYKEALNRLSALGVDQAYEFAQSPGFVLVVQEFVYKILVESLRLYHVKVDVHFDSCGVALAYAIQGHPRVALSITGKPDAPFDEAIQNYLAVADNVANTILASGSFEAVGEPLALEFTRLLAELMVQYKSWSTFPIVLKPYLGNFTSRMQELSAMCQAEQACFVQSTRFLLPVMEYLQKLVCESERQFGTPSGMEKTIPMLASAFNVRYALVASVQTQDRIFTALVDSTNEWLDVLYQVNTFICRSGTKTIGMVGRNKANEFCDATHKFITCFHTWSNHVQRVKRLTTCIRDIHSLLECTSPHDNDFVSHCRVSLSKFEEQLRLFVGDESCAQIMQTLKEGTG